jgi:hypothetical protein
MDTNRNDVLLDSMARASGYENRDALAAAFVPTVVLPEQSAKETLKRYKDRRKRERALRRMIQAN